ncbi:thiosulfate oxidation carrier protein SoxY [Stutzerimonas tarimensis]|uniref:Thiosulfate oxidation carrier protein SoxY n=1 Tax=Stutzerimonas tarimensis TaxID=1507735 RepID=A0ABV7T516_9GAMM
MLREGRLQASGLNLEAPEWVEDGAFVPVTVRLEGARAPLRLALLRNGEDDPRVARVGLLEWREPLEFSTRVRLSGSQDIEVVARDADGRVWQVSRPVRVAGSSCLAAPSGYPLAELGLTRAWLRSREAGLELVSLLRHPMESGRRLDAAGQPLPKRLLQRLTLIRDGETLLEVEPFEGLSANPYWRVLLAPGSAELEMRWSDADGSLYLHRL